MALFAALWIVTLASGCSESGDGVPLAGDGELSREEGYRLVILDSEKEVRRRHTGEAEVPWAEGMKGNRFESTLLTSKEGFVLPDAFLDHWGNELTTVLVEYGYTDGNAYMDFGWVLRRSPGAATEVTIQFKEPLGFGSVKGKRIKTTVEAYVMKRDATSLFDPRGSEKGKPELEGNGTATMRFDHVARNGNALRFDYELQFTGQGVIRYFGATGEEWILGEEDTFHLDREEACEIVVTRHGEKEFSRDVSGMWRLDRDVFQETWHAESMESEARVHESSMSGAGRTYALTRATLRARGERETGRHWTRPPSMPRSMPAAIRGAGPCAFPRASFFPARFT